MACTTATGGNNVPPQPRKRPTVLVLGGALNPVHLGHLHALVVAAQHIHHVWPHLELRCASLAAAPDGYLRAKQEHRRNKSKTKTRELNVPNERENVDSTENNDNNSGAISDFLLSGSQRLRLIQLLVNEKWETMATTNQPSFECPTRTFGSAQECARHMLRGLVSVQACGRTASSQGSGRTAVEDEGDWAIVVVHGSDRGLKKATQNTANTYSNNKVDSDDYDEKRSVYNVVVMREGEAPPDLDLRPGWTLCHHDTTIPAQEEGEEDNEAKRSDRGRCVKSIVPAASSTRIREALGRSILLANTGGNLREQQQELRQWYGIADGEESLFLNELLSAAFTALTKGAVSVE